eukprot:CAMPEP_0181404130 /NCGR_PEP_ID=MMETSP1110-20121109/4082_1 /TAXON_ID=174948 /ORGANISM="Symbiodinium sp., Strain CCMP421" /LENGTH=536 /DNA_ID=CAMNT_0023526471 /DNA_START=243 /DNA_END=1853 /DNA_ORIENTATION=+
MYYGVTGDFLKLGLSVSAESDAGWSALAFGGNGGMKGAQQFVVRKVDGRFVAEERYSKSFTTPQLQAVQQVQLIFATEESGHVAWGILLPLNSCEEGERYGVEDVSIMQWALGAGHDFLQHVRRGSMRVNLLSGPSNLNLAGLKNYKKVTLRMPNISLPHVNANVQNQWVCAFFDLKEVIPDIDTKHHVAAMTLAEDPQTFRYFHHMISIWCPEGAYTHLQTLEECKMTPPECSQAFFSFTTGNTAGVLPAEAGFPIGGVGKRFLALQVHYNDPSSNFGFQDSVGVNLFIADSLRPHDAGLLLLAGPGCWPERQILADIPPGLQNYAAQPVLVPSSCTREWKAEEVTVLSQLYHAHAAGTNMTTEVFRGSQRIGMLRQEKLYDYNFQAFAPTGSVQKLRRGDELLFTCNYNTSNRRSPIKWGKGTDVEMCGSVLTYYPVQELKGAWLVEDGLVYCDGASHAWHNFSRPPSTPSPPCVSRGNLFSQPALDLLVAMNTGKPTDRTPPLQGQVGQVAVAVFAARMSWLLSFASLFTFLA